MARHWTEIEGWLSPAQGQALQELAAGGDVLELGSYKGRSTCCLAAAARQVSSVDWHGGDAGTGPADTLGRFVANLEALGVRDRVILRVVRFEDLGDSLPVGWYDLVFVDGAHDAESVERDTRIALKAVKPGGAIAWHDWDYESVREGAARAGLAAEHVVGDLGWCRVPR